jgi:hypothetical protein
MAESQIREYATAKGFHPQTVSRWLSWNPADTLALERLVFALKISENHLRDLLDWLEEVALRDQVAVHVILASKTIDDIATDPRLGRADRLKKIKEQIRRLRYPRLAETEDALRGKIQELQLHPEIRLSVPPGLEGGQIRVEFSVANHEELRRLASNLKNATEHQLMPEIFQLLSGQSSK